ncbi:Molybdopterin converting factor, large subunit [Corynebacterium camporealensis]|nr:Molybdopterin converting factor, large subunit [Corynebacterium camporealensis]
MSTNPADPSYVAQDTGVLLGAEISNQPLQAPDISTPTMGAVVRFDGIVRNHDAATVAWNCSPTPATPAPRSASRKSLKKSSKTTRMYACGAHTASVICRLAMPPSSSWLPPPTARLLSMPPPPLPIASKPKYLSGKSSNSMTATPPGWVLE